MTSVVDQDQTAFFARVLGLDKTRIPVLIRRKDENVQPKRIVVAQVQPNDDGTITVTTPLNRCYKLSPDEEIFLEYS